MADGLGGTVLNQYPEAYVTNREIYPIDLGPTEELASLDIGPASESQEEALDDATNLEYIDTRIPDGSHCMDDRIRRPGIQLPGGLGQTLVVSRRFTPGAKFGRLKKSDAYRDATEEAIEVFQTIPYWHNGCAAEDYEAKIIQTLGDNPMDAAEFVFDGMVRLGLVPNTPEMARIVGRKVFRSIYIANERLEDGSLNDVSQEEARSIAGEAGAEFEHVEGEHNVAGAIVEYAGNRFNNSLFMDEHIVHGKPVGVIAVTMGAFRNLMLSRKLEDMKIETEIMHAQMYAYGALKRIWSHYVLPQGIAAKINEEY